MSLEEKLKEIENINGFDTYEFDPSSYNEGQDKRARELVQKVAEEYKDNPEKLKKYFKGKFHFWKNADLSGVATSAYYQLTGDIEPILKYVNGGWGAVIHSKQEGLEFIGTPSDGKLKYALIKEGGLPKAKFFHSANYATFEKYSVKQAEFDSFSCWHSAFDSFSGLDSTFSIESGRRSWFKAYSVTGAIFTEGSGDDSKFDDWSGLATDFVRDSVYHPISRSALIGSTGYLFYVLNPNSTLDGRTYLPAMPHLSFVNGAVIDNGISQNTVIERALIPVVINQLFDGGSILDTLKVMADSYAEKGILLQSLMPQLAAESRRITFGDIERCKDPAASAVLLVLSRMYVQCPGR